MRFSEFRSFADLDRQFVEISDSYKLAAVAKWLRRAWSAVQRRRFRGAPWCPETSSRAQAPRRVGRNRGYLGISRSSGQKADLVNHPAGLRPLQLLDRRQHSPHVPAQSSSLRRIAGASCRVCYAVAACICSKPAEGGCFAILRPRTRLCTSFDSLARLSIRSHRSSARSLSKLCPESSRSATARCMPRARCLKPSSIIGITGPSS